MDPFHIIVSIGIVLVRVSVRQTYDRSIVGIASLSSLRHALSW